MKKKFIPFLMILLILSSCIPAGTLTPTATQIPPSPAPPTATLEPKPIPYTTPDWFDTAILYEIFVRSYADSDGDGVGDLLGIVERLDHIQSLGVDVIWLMPVYPSPSTHGYGITDFFEINPDYGTLADLQTLVGEVHAREMRLILDFVPSHLSNQNPMFQQAYGNPQAENSDWFLFTNDSNTKYTGFANLADLPRFNHYNPEVEDYLIEAALFWLDLNGDGDYSDGVDGFRVDNVTFPPKEFFLAFRQAVKTANPEALLLGEAWATEQRTLRTFYLDQFDALFDFPLYAQFQSNHDTNGDGLLAGRGFPVVLDSLLEKERKNYPLEAQAVRFLSNHDTNRIATEVSGDLARQKLGAALLAVLPGPVMVYYGEEIGMLGQKGSAPYWDDYRRGPMDWYAAESGPGQTTWFMVEDRWNAPGDGISVEEQENDPDSLLNYYRMALNLRQDTPALHHGAYAPLNVSGSSLVWGLIRETDGQIAAAVFNFGDEAVEVTIPAFPFSAEVVVDLLTGAEYPAAVEGEAYVLNLPAAGVVILAGE